MAKQKNNAPKRVQPSTPRPAASHKSPAATPRKSLRLPVILITFALIYAWAVCYYGDVFRIIREYSFWVPDLDQMKFVTDRPWGMLWVVGRMLLQLFRYPWLGGLMLSAMLTGGSWLLGYCLRLPARLRALQFLPAMGYIGYITFLGFDTYFEAETGMLLGIPALVVLALLVIAVIIRTFSRKPILPMLWISHDETLLTSGIQVGTVAVLLAGIVGYGLIERPYVPVVCRMQRQCIEQDWQGVQETARAHAELSYRPLAAYYAISLVHTGEILSRLYDIRLDYDDPYLHGFNQEDNNATNYYLQDCDLHAGLVLTAIHHGMEQMTMNGPSVRTLELLTKCALLRGEWEVAKKYMRVLQQVPFEGDFIERYRPMLYHPELVDADPEFAVLRQTEPLHDSFENLYVQPVFLGYNAALFEGRSMNALHNSLAVNLYTKTMQEFLMRCQPLAGTLPPENVQDALLLMTGKNPSISEAFPKEMDWRLPQLQNFISENNAYMQARPGITEEEKAELIRLGHTPSGKDTLISSENRALHARELFPKYKGYYPYYYFFGNLKATKKKKENEGTSNQGVN